MKQHGGFSLLELAIVLVIIGLLIGTLLMPLVASKTAQDIRRTEEVLEKARAALIGYAIINSGFPCPDNNDDGEMDSGCESPALASTREGDLPWKTLGIEGKDAWGNQLTYRVDKAYLAIAVSGSIAPSESLLIEDTGGIALTNDVDHVVIAVILSEGKNKQPDNNNNHADGGTTFVKDSFVEGSFDDLVTWISRNTLAYHLLTAGKKP